MLILFAVCIHLDPIFYLNHIQGQTIAILTDGKHNIEAAGYF